MSAIREAESQDLPPIVAIHQVAFKGFFTTLLGAKFLHEYYRLIITYPKSILLVAEEEDGVVGFVAGYADPPLFYERMKAERKRLVWPVVLAVLKNPRLLPRLLANLRRVEEAAAGGSLPDRRESTLISIAVHPDHSGKGIGRALVQAFLDKSRELGADYVRLSTDAENNEFANRFYQRLGFERSRTFKASGQRPMNEYVLDLQSEGSHRVTESPSV